MDHAVSGHGIHFYRVDRDLSLEHFWTETGRTPEDLKFLLDLGAVYLNSERLVVRTNLKSQDIVRVHTEPKRYSVPPSPPDHLVIYESDDYLVLNKPAGLPVHPTLDNRVENCLSWLGCTRGSNFLVLNRIDVGTEGLIAFAKNERAQRIFMKQVQELRIEKSYSAVCSAPIRKGRLEHWMMPSPYPPKILSSQSSPEWKHCLSEVTDTLTCGEFFECHVRLHTGRTHQLRAQLSNERAPILGDRLYGSQVQFRTPQSWALRSVELGFRDGRKHIRLELPRWTAGEILDRLSDSI